MKAQWMKRSMQSIVLLYFAGLVIVPIAAVFHEGFSEGLSSFVSALANPIAWDAVLRTVRLALIAALINAVIGTMVAWTLVRGRFPGRRFLHALVDLPFALPTAVGGLLILLLLGPQSGFGTWLQSLGFEVVFQEPAIVIAMVFVTFPFVIRAIQPLLEEMDPAQEEAAHTLGASRSATFRKVILPTIRPGLLAGTLLAFSRALAEFGAVVLVAGNLPGQTLVASVYIFGQIESSNPQGAAAVSILLLTLSFLLIWGVNRMQERGQER